MLNKTFNVRITQPYNSSNPIKWELGYHWGIGNQYFINQNNSKEIQDIFKLILNSKNVVGKGDVVYASKASELPRFKLKEFIKDNGLKKTSRYAYANCIIINKGYFLELLKDFKYNTYTFVKEDHVKSNYKKWIKGSAEGEVESIIRQSTDMNLVTIVNDYTVKESKKILAKFPAEMKIYEDNTYEVKGTFIDLYRNDRLKNLLDIIIELKNDIKLDKIKFVFDEELFVELNKEGIELDDEYLQTLRDMLFSKDDSNIKLGFEMMSNLVVDQSMLLSVSFLLNELIHTTKFRPSYYTNSNSNLKSLFKLLRTKGIYWERDWKTFGTGLRSNFKTGKEGDIVKKFLLDNINREFKLSNSAAESLVDIVFSTETQNIN